MLLRQFFRKLPSGVMIPSVSPFLFFTGGDLSRRWASMLSICEPSVCVSACVRVWMCVFSREGESRMSVSPKSSESATLRASWATAGDCRGGQIDGWVGKWCTHYSVVLSHHMTGCYRWSLSCLLYIYSNIKGLMMQSKQDLLCIQICFIRMLKVG